jgi:hypothetical protein
MARHIRSPVPTQRSSRANMNRLMRGGVEDNLLRKHRRHLDRPLSTSIILEGSEVDNGIDEPLVLLARGLISCAPSLASTRQFVFSGRHRVQNPAGRHADQHRFLMRGTIWADAEDYSIVQGEGRGE